MALTSEEQFCYVTTTGRRTGRPHEIEIWFGRERSTLYLLAGGGRRADWVRNIAASPAVRVKVGGEVHRATGRVVEEPGEEALARHLVAGKYQGWREGQPRSGWASSALVIALDLQRAG